MFNLKQARWEPPLLPKFDTRVGINQVTKLAVLARLEFIVQTEPYVHSTFGDDKEIHPGEVFAGAQALVVQGDNTGPTIAVSYVRRFYESPAPELDVGTFRESGTILISQDIAGFHFALMPLAIWGQSRFPTEEPCD